MNSQYKKGVVELCVLSLLYRQDCYGYDVSEYLSRHIEIADGTVYPVLRKLKSDGYVTTYLSEESGGPPRKYYSLTKTGRAEFLRQKDEWSAFAKSIEILLEGESEDEKRDISE
jgi:PadR family transcriptional regulator PadR